MSEKGKKELSFSSSQQRVIDSRGKNLLVSASAGAGKTAVLVERLCRLVTEDRVPIDAILAMTFTEDAAREMKTRLKERLMKMEQDPWISRQISQLETASISTIHSFCLDIVQHYYYLAGLSYSMATTVDNGLPDEQAMAQALVLASEQIDASRMAALRLYMESFSQSEDDLRKAILKFLEIARSKPDSSAWMNSCRHIDPAMTPWFFWWYEMRVEALIEIFEYMVEAVGELEFSKLEKQQEWIRLFQNKVDQLKACRSLLEQRDYPGFSRAFFDYLTTTGKFTPKVNKVSFESFQKDSRRYEKDIAEALFHQDDFERGARSVQDVRETFIDLAQSVEREFARLKAQAQFIDFGDMEQFAWQILQYPQAADELRERYQVILIDEYQDTNDLQEAIIQAIARHNNVFRVGDIKQSIYGFRQARPDLMQHHLDHAGKDDEVIAMQENYRSTARLIRFNNSFFSQLMNAKGMPKQFSAMDEARPGLLRQSEDEQRPIRFLYTVYGNWTAPKAGPDDRPSMIEAKRVHRQNRYDLIARDIVRKVRARSIDLRDIAILSRSSTPHEELKNALEAWGIRAIHHMKKGFYTNKAVQIVLSAMRVIADRRNDVALMAALCSPLTGCTQNDLLPLLEGRDKNQSLYQTLCESEKGRRILTMVFDMKDWIDRPLPEIITSIYAYNDFYTDSTTSQDKTNLDLLLQKAVDASGLMDLDAFLDSAGLEENLDKTSEAIPFAREENAVRISTIHASKGLQYKLVYLLSEQTNPDMDARHPIRLDSDLGLSLDGLDLDAGLKQRSASDLAFSHKRFIEDLQEKMRLLYVACTRAERELVFVDTLKSDDLYDWDLDTHALLSNNGFTSWFFHVWHRHPGLDVRFEEEDILERPDGGQLSRNRTYRFETYRLPTVPVYSQTASRKKQTLDWPARDRQEKTGSIEARSRGTLLHELAARLPYPYRREQIEDYLRASRQELPERSIEDLLSLNRCAQYARWMEVEHVFECPYIATEEGAIVHGYIDLAAFDGRNIAILDFKSDRVMNRQSLIDRYGVQLKTYAKAMEQIDPEADITCWIYSFELQELFPVER